MIGISVPEGCSPSDDVQKVMSVWFFCQLLMVTFARSSVLLRLDVAPQHSKKTVMRAD
jgi:hypothetical protein